MNYAMGLASWFFMCFGVTCRVINHREGSEDTRPGVGLYARVSSSDQRNDLDAQLGRVAGYAHSHRLTIVEAVSEVGSGLNGHRRKLMRLLADPKVGALVVEHRERLMGFGAA